jgi:hypothetical protein
MDLWRDRQILELEVGVTRTSGRMRLFPGKPLSASLVARQKFYTELWCFAIVSDAKAYSGFLIAKYITGTLPVIPTVVIYQ